MLRRPKLSKNEVVAPKEEEDRQCTKLENTKKREGKKKQECKQNKQIKNVLKKGIQKQNTQWHKYLKWYKNFILTL